MRSLLIYSYPFVNRALISARGWDTPRTRELPFPDLDPDGVERGKKFYNLVFGKIVGDDAVVSPERVRFNFDSLTGPHIPLGKPREVQAPSGHKDSYSLPGQGLPPRRRRMACQVEHQHQGKCPVTEGQAPCVCGDKTDRSELCSTPAETECLTGEIHPDNLSRYGFISRPRKAGIRSGYRSAASFRLFRQHEIRWFRQRARGRSTSRLRRAATRPRRTPGKKGSSRHRTPVPEPCPLPGAAV